MEEPKCKICGDTGRAKPTLSEPDGEECECTKEPSIMASEPHIIGRRKKGVKDGKQNRKRRKCFFG